MMRVLGLDPGLRNTGWGVIEAEGNRLRHIANGVVTSVPEDDLAARLLQLADGIEEVLRAFGVPILNRYGGRELSVMACQFEASGPLFVMRPWLFLEIVDEQGKAVSPGEPGKLLWTSTVCRGTPFLRYEIGDLGTASAGHQTEAGIAAIQELCGRDAGLVRLPDGRQISNLYWNHLFKKYAEVTQFQVVVRGERGFRLLLKGKGLSASREARLRSTLRHSLARIYLWRSPGWTRSP